MVDKPVNFYSGTSITEPTNDVNALMVLLFDGANGSTTFTDATGNHSPTVGAATVELDTSTYVAGVSSCRFDSDISSGYISVSDSEDWNWVSAEKTFETWFMLTSRADMQAYHFEFFSQGSLGAPSEPYNIFLVKYDNVSGNDFVRYYHRNTAGQSDSYIWWLPENIAINTWYHIALVKEDIGSWGRLTVYLNGVSCGVNDPIKSLGSSGTGDMKIGVSIHISQVRPWYMDNYAWHSVVRTDFGSTLIPLNFYDAGTPINFYSRTV